MRIIEFENENEAPLVLVVRPWDDRHEVPHLARAGLRYSVAPGEEDRCYAAVSTRGIDVWCNATSYDIDIVPPLPVELLLWDVGVTGGWCGGLVDGEPTTVIDLLPASGMVTAEDFATLVIRADGETAPRPRDDRSHHWLQAKFVEHMGCSAAHVSQLRQISRRPFDQECGV